MIPVFTLHGYFEERFGPMFYDVLGVVLLHATGGKQQSPF